MQSKIPFITNGTDFQKLAYNDNVYAWLLSHSNKNPIENYYYIYKEKATYTQIGQEIHKTRQTIAKRIQQLIKDGYIFEKTFYGKTAYIIPIREPFQYLHAETVIKLLNLPLKDQKEELIKTLAYLLNKKRIFSDDKGIFNITSKEILTAFGHSAGEKSNYERTRANLAVLQNAGIIKFRVINLKCRGGVRPFMHVYYVSPEGRASDEWLGVREVTQPEKTTEEQIEQKTE